MKLSIVDLAPVPPGASAATAFANTIDLAQAAERLGYRRFWVAEHHGIASAIANCSPELLIGRVAAATSSIRVGSGSVLLNYSSPFRIAEQFRVLHALFPDRIDLGVGRASSTLADVDRALRRPGQLDADDDDDPAARLMAWIEHEDQVAEVVAWLDDAFPAGHPYAAIRVLPGVSGGPEPWLLGASTSSAILAGRLGLRYCFAAFINPAEMTSALHAYRAAFRPSPLPSAVTEPYVMVGVHLCCADTDASAHRLRASVELFYRRMAASDGWAEGLAGAATAVTELGAVPPPTEVSAPLLSGGPERAAELLDQIATATEADEIIIQDLIADHDDRLRSYELIARCRERRRQGDVVVQLADRRATAENATRSPR